MMLIYVCESSPVMQRRHKDIRFIKLKCEQSAGNNIFIIRLVGIVQYKLIEYIVSSVLLRDFKQLR